MQALCCLLGAAFLVGCAPLTVGETCDQVMKATCERGAVCLNASASEIGPCISAGIAECCEGPRCQAPVKEPAAVEKCLDATKRQECSAWQAAVGGSAPFPVPGVCKGVAQPR